MITKALKVGMAIIISAFLETGCLSFGFTLKTSGNFNGTYLSIEGTYTGPLFFHFVQEDEAIEVDGKITVNTEVIEFTGSGTLTRDPRELDLNVTGTGFTMHIWGKVVNSHLEGSYTFSSSKWGSDTGSVELSQS